MKVTLSRYMVRIMTSEEVKLEMQRNNTDLTSQNQQLLKEAKICNRVI